jgi:hypothetical protein
MQAGNKLFERRRPGVFPGLSFSIYRKLFTAEIAENADQKVIYGITGSTRCDGIVVEQ